MRLIDADLFLEETSKDPLFPLVERYGLSYVIKAQPTVDAIPIEWLKEWFKKRYKGRTYRDLIEEWESEQFWEKEHEIDRC